MSGAAEEDIRAVLRPGLNEDEIQAASERLLNLAAPC